jgi:hypothetical protein
MTDEASEAFEHAMAAAERLRRAWEGRTESREELSTALEDYNRAGKDLADLWNRAEDRRTPFR